MTPDDPLFRRLNPVQWRWIADQIAQDEVDKIDLYFDFADYLAQFWNSEAVQRVRNERLARQSVEGDEESTEVFEQQIEQWFGRDKKLSNRNA